MRSKIDQIGLVKPDLAGALQYCASEDNSPDGIKVLIVEGGRQRPKALARDGNAGIPGFKAKYAAGAEIYGEAERASHAYRVLSGVVRTFRVLSDGRRQIEGFHFGGDAFCLLPPDHYGESAEAITDTEVFVMKKSLVEFLADTDTGVSRELLKWTNESLVRAREQILLLGRKSAIEKVASFLLQIEPIGGQPDSLVLPMPRSDIADYLGLTIETVSRVLTQLEKSRAIVLTKCRSVRVTCRPTLIFLSGQV